MLFLWVFLPTVIVVNFVLTVIKFKDERLRTKVKNAFLLFASLFFYAWGGIYYVLIMIASIAINFSGGYLINKVADQSAKIKKLVLALTLALNLGMLFFFKYFNMLVVVIEAILEGGGFANVWASMISMKGTGALGIAQIALPIGISFFTFQAMSYVIDVYTKKVEVQKNLFDFALYVALFPQLIAGPIVKYSDIAAQLQSREESLQLFLEGIKRFCYGLGKKVLIANIFAEVADKIWKLNTATLGADVAWLGLIAYTFQIYYDFSGYSDMAIGLGKMFGFQFRENFNYPYTSLSVQEFWRRWHISLSTWFKEYVYIPLGGNRKGKARTYVNLFVVFLLTGIWHGANFTFLIWGLYFGILLVIERLGFGKLLQKNPIKPLNWLYTIFAVMLGWVYFRSDNIYQANQYIVQLFNFRQAEVTALTYLNLKVIIALVFAVMFSGLLQRPLAKYYEKVRHTISVQILDYSAQMLILVYCIFVLVSGSYNPFIYFQF